MTSAREPRQDEGPESPLARWSRRKRAARDSAPEASDESPPEVVESSRPPAPRGAEENPPSRVLGDADMPALESLGAESDYSAFLSPGVSEELRRLALRKLFHAPLFNITDGLDDYDDDFTTFEVLQEAFHARRIERTAPESTRAEHPESESTARVPAEEEPEAAQDDAADESASPPVAPSSKGGEATAAASALPPPGLPELASVPASGTPGDMPGGGSGDDVESGCAPSTETPADPSRADAPRGERAGEVGAAPDPRAAAARDVTAEDEESAGRADAPRAREPAALRGHALPDDAGESGHG